MAKYTVGRPNSSTATECLALYCLLQLLQEFAKVSRLKAELEMKEVIRRQVLDICIRCGQQLNTPGSATTIASSELSGSPLSDDPAKRTADSHSCTVVY